MKWLYFVILSTTKMASIPSYFGKALMKSMAWKKLVQRHLMLGRLNGLIFLLLSNNIDFIAPSDMFLQSLPTKSSLDCINHFLRPHISTNLGMVKMSLEFLEQDNLPSYDYFPLFHSRLMRTKYPQILWFHSLR